MRVEHRTGAVVRSHAPIWVGENRGRQNQRRIADIGDRIRDILLFVSAAVLTFWWVLTLD